MSERGHTSADTVARRERVLTSLVRVERATQRLAAGTPERLGHKNEMAASNHRPQRMMMKVTRETTLPAGIATGALIVAMLAGCSSAAAPPSATASVSPELSAPATPAPSATPGPAPTGELLYEVWKNEVQAGGHGGAPVLAFPSAFIVDYQVDGTCTFTIGFGTATGADGGLPHFSLAVHGSRRSGSWSVSIPAGMYSPLVGPEAGCTFHVLMQTR